MRRSRFFSRPDWHDRVARYYGSASARFSPFEIPGGEQPVRAGYHLMQEWAVPRVGRSPRASDGVGANRFVALRFGTAPASDYLDPMNGCEDPALLLNTALSDAGEAGARFLWWSNVPRPSDLFEELAGRAESDHRARVIPCVSTLGIEGGRSFEDYLSAMSRNRRRNFWRFRKKADGLAPHFHCGALTKADVEFLLRHQERRARASEHLGAIIDDERFTRLIRSLVGMEGVEAARLELEGEPASVLLILRDTEGAAIYAQAFDIRWADRLYPSLALISFFVEHAFERGVGYIDFLRGTESYKRRFVDREITMAKFVYDLSDAPEADRLAEWVGGVEE